MHIRMYFSDKQNFHYFEEKRYCYCLVNLFSWRDYRVPAMSVRAMRRVHFDNIKAHESGARRIASQSLAIFYKRNIYARAQTSEHTLARNIQMNF